MGESKPSIGIVYDVAYPFVEGGGQKRLFEVGKRLVQRGWSVNWYCFKTWEGKKTLFHEGITYYGLEGYSNLYVQNGRRSIKAALSFGAAIVKLNGSFYKNSVLWCGQWPYFHIFAIMLRKPFRRPPVVIDWWETWDKHWYEYLGKAGFGGRIIERIASRLGDHKVCISEIGKRDIEKIGSDSRNLIVIPNGIDFKMISSIQPYPEKCEIIFLGRLKNHKNVDHIIKAIKILADSGRDVRLNIIGDGPEKENLTNLCIKFGMLEHVTFLGAIESTKEVYQRLKSALLFVNTSTKEGGGSITLFEANACGLPVIAYRHPLGIDPSLISEGENGYIVEKISPEGIAQAIADIIDMTENLDSLKLKCIEKSKGYDWDIIAEHYDNLFSRLGGINERESV